MDRLLEALASGLFLRSDTLEPASDEAKEAFKQAVKQRLDLVKAEQGGKICFDHYLAKLRNQKKYLEPTLVESSNRELLEVLAELPEPPSGSYYTLPDKTVLVFEAKYFPDEDQTKIVPTIVCEWIQKAMASQ